MFQITNHQFSSVQSFSHFQLFATPWTAARQASLSITNSQSLLKLMSIESVMPSNHLILCHPLLLPPSIFPSIRVFSNESVLHIRSPKYWSFSYNISPSNTSPSWPSYFQFPTIVMNPLSFLFLLIWLLICQIALPFGSYFFFHSNVIDNKSLKSKVMSWDNYTVLFNILAQNYL